ATSKSISFSFPRLRGKPSALRNLGSEARGVNGADSPTPTSASSASRSSLGSWTRPASGGKMHGTFIMKIERRSVLRAGGAVLLAAAPLSLLLNRRGQPEPAKTPASAGPHALGGIERDPNRLLDLRAGFTYTVVERFGDAMSDGHRVPGLADGMACFPGPDGTLVLMRNHEVERQAAFAAYRGKAPAHAYDPNAYGGVTRVVVDARTGA